MDLYSWFNCSKNLTFYAGIFTALAAIATCVGMAGERYFGNTIKQLENKKNEQIVLGLRQELEKSSKRIEALKNVVADRIVMPSDANQIIEYLKQHKQESTLSISARNNERETVVFATQIHRLFKEGNWEIGGPIISLVPGEFKGVGILIKDATNKPKDLVLIEHVLMGILKLNVEGAIEKEFQDNQIAIVIGAQRN